MTIAAVVLFIGVMIFALLTIGVVYSDESGMAWIAVLMLLCGGFTAYALLKLVGVTL